MTEMMPPGARAKITRIAAAALLCVIVAGGGYAWRSRRVAERNQLLLGAIEHADARGVREALNLGADPNARRALEQRDKRRADMTGGIGIDRSSRLKGATALMAAADKSSEVLNLLLDHGADANLIGSERGEWSALMYAAQSRTLQNVRALLDHGADVNHRDQLGGSALGIAAARGDSRMVDLLLDYNARPNVEDMTGMTPLLHALLTAPASSRLACMESLLRHNAIPDQGIHGTTAICLAIQRDMPEAVEVLLKHNAAINGLFVGGKSPLDLAREKGNPKIVAMLLKAGAKPANETATTNTKDTMDKKSTKLGSSSGQARVGRHN